MMLNVSAPVAASRIYLVGFMASGKTSVGAALAVREGLRFIDLDREIESRAGLEIRRIFARRGEAAFRELEHQALLATVSEDGVVVATGGGAMAFERNREVIQEAGMSIWLDASFDSLVARLDGEGRNQRPLFQDEERARELFEERLSAYRLADLHVQVSAGDTASGVAARISRLLPRGSLCAT